MTTDALIDHRPGRGSRRQSVAAPVARSGEELLHEVRSTVAGLARACELLASERIPAPRRASLADSLAAEVWRLERMLDPDRLPELVVLDLEPTVAAVVETHRARGLPVRWSGTAARVIGDRDHIAEVLGILLDNALAHAGALPTEVSAHLRRGCVELRVTDSGPGIDPAVRGSLFSRGVHRSGSRGHGLGLHLARELVESMGGTISCRHAPPGGTGACFAVRLRGHAGRGS